MGVSSMPLHGRRVGMHTQGRTLELGRPAVKRIVCLQCGCRRGLWTFRSSPMFDFLLYTLEDGRRVRLLGVVDDFTRACLAIEVATPIGGRRVVEVRWHQLAQIRNQGPAMLRSA